MFVILGVHLDVFGMAIPFGPNLRSSFVAWLVQPEAVAGEGPHSKSLQGGVKRRSFEQIWKM